MRLLTKVFSHPEAMPLNGTSPISTCFLLFRAVDWGVDTLLVLQARCITRNWRMLLMPLYRDIGSIFLVSLATNDSGNALLAEKVCSRKDPSVKARLIDGPGAVKREHNFKLIQRLI